MGADSGCDDTLLKICSELARIRMAVSLLTSHPGLKPLLQGMRSRDFWTLGKSESHGMVQTCEVGGRVGAREESLSLNHLGPHRCVQQLLQHGASVNSRTEEEDDTALHIAARHGLTDHVQLLLRYGAELEAKNEEGQTPLNAACAQPHQPQDMDRYYRVCQLLVESGASINAADRDRQHPLHLACKNANAQVAELLLARGANVNVMNYSGNTALHNILQATAYKLEHHPELVVRALLNYGAIRIWPGSLLKVWGSQLCWEHGGKGRLRPSGPQ